MRKEFDEYRVRLRFYWVYKVVVFVGIMMILLGVVFMVITAGHYDKVTMINIDSETWTTSKYLIYGLISVLDICFGSVIIKLGKYASYIQEDWINDFENKVCDIL